ncbi:MAG: cytochrome c [Myxococcota bacterium]
MSLNHPILALSLAATLTGCLFSRHDAGDEAFAAQAIDTVLGRKPHGAAEVRALADLAATDGRQAVLDALFAEPDYVTYWSNALLDHLQLQRAGAMAVDPDCTAPAILPADRQLALADHLATADPTVPFCWYVPPPPWDPLDYGIIADVAVNKALDGYTGATLAQIGEPKLLEQPAPLLEWVDPKVPLGFTERPELDLPRFDGGPLPFDPLPTWVTTPDLRDFFDPEYQLQIVDEQELGGWRCPPFDLTDVAEAAVRADRLDALYRAYLPVLASFPTSADDDEALQNELGGRFLDVYLDRDPTCMTCHTTTYSRTDPRPANGNWDRFYPASQGGTVPFDAEGSVFSWGGAVSATSTLRRRRRRVQAQVGALFRADGRDAGGLHLGIDDACVVNPRVKFDGFTAPPADPSRFAAFGETVGDDRGVLDLVNAFADGVRTLPGLQLVQPDWAGYRARQGATATAQGCDGCHASGVNGAPPLAQAAATMSDDRLFGIVRFGTGRMRAQTSSDRDAWDAVAWVRQQYPAVPALQLADRDHAFVYLVAANACGPGGGRGHGRGPRDAARLPRNPADPSC